MALEIREAKVAESYPKDSAQRIQSLTLSDDQKKVLGKWYKDFEAIGTGKYSNVFRCTHHLSEQTFAIKVIPISKDEKKNGVPYRIIREISALKELDHPNIVKLEDMLTTEDEVFLVFENLDSDLYALLRNPSNILCSSKVKEFIRQILTALTYCHTHKILHRDVKPSNILIRSSDDVLKIADFGLARPFDIPPSSSYSNDMSSPCYRAPEILLGSTEYTSSSDVWSAGCIFAEMILGRPLFPSADSNWKMLNEIFNLVGTPTEINWPGITTLCDIEAIFGPPKKPKDPARVFPHLAPDALDLLSRLLCVCPKYRVEAEDALVHPYFKDS